MFIKILFKILLSKGGVLIYAEHCIKTHTYSIYFIIYIIYKHISNINIIKTSFSYIYIYIYIYIYACVCIYIYIINKHSTQTCIV